MVKYECWHVVHVSTLEEYCAVMLQWWWFCRTQSLFPNWSGWSAWVKPWHKWQRGWWLVEQPACHWVHQQSEGMYSNLCTVSKNSPYTWLTYLFYNTWILWIQCICLCNLIFGTQTDASPHICVIFHGIYSVKEAKVLVTVCSSALVYNNTLSLLSFIIPHRLTHCCNLIHHRTHELSFAHPNTCSSMAHCQSCVSHN